MDIVKLIQVAKVVGDIVKTITPAAIEIRHKLAAAKVDVTDAEWAALDKGFQNIIDVAKAEIETKG